MRNFVCDIDGSFIDLDHAVAIEATGQVHMVNGDVYQLGKGVLEAVMDALDRDAAVQLEQQDLLS